MRIYSYYTLLVCYSFACMYKSNLYLYFKRVPCSTAGYSEAAGYQPQPMAYAVTVSSGNYYAGPGGATSATPQTQAVAPPLFGGQVGGGVGGQYMGGGVPHLVGSSVTIPGGARGAQHRGRRSGARTPHVELSPQAPDAYQL